MALPKVPTRSETIQLEGQDVTVRGLTRHEAFLVQRATKAGDVENAEIMMIAAGTDTPEDEVRDWYATASNEVAGPLADAIVRLSGLGEEARKSSGESLPAG